jgi:hypothetical protein
MAGAGWIERCGEDSMKLEKMADKRSNICLNILRRGYVLNLTGVKIMLRSPALFDN